MELCSLLGLPSPGQKIMEGKNLSHGVRREQRPCWEAGSHGEGILSGKDFKNHWEIG